MRVMRATKRPRLAAAQDSDRRQHSPATSASSATDVTTRANFDVRYAVRGVNVHADDMRIFP